jgi:hypothetical protein
MNIARHSTATYLRSCLVALFLVIAATLASAATATVPSAPSNVSVTTGDGQVSIAFTAPTALTGFTISGYTASCTLTGSSVPATATATQSPITVTGLSAGSYSCAVVTNFKGSTDASGSVSAVKTAPTALSASTGSASVSIEFATFTGASTHTASCVPTTGTTVTGNPVSTSPAKVTLTNGVTYTCSLIATSATAVVSSASSVGTITPVASTGTTVSTVVAPSIKGVLPGDSRISVMYNYIGGKIQGTGNGSDVYTASCTSTTGGTAGKSSTSAEFSSGIGTLPKANYTNPLVVSGLTNGKSYTCTVTATRGSTSGTSAASTAVTPNAGPSNALGVLASAVNSTFNTTFSSYASYCNYSTAGATTAGAGAVPSISVYPTTATTSTAAKVTIPSSSSVSCSGTTTRTISGNALPDHRSSEFFTNGLSGYTTSPNFSGNPNSIGAKTVSKTVPYSGTQKGTYTQGANGYNTTACYSYSQTVGSTPTAASNCTYVSYPAYLNNSVKVEPGTAETYASSSGVKTTYKVAGKNLYQDVGLDPSNAHNQPTMSGNSTLMFGYYHYHGIPEGYVTRLGKGNSTMTLVGFAVDGYPIYARYGYTNRTTTTGGVKIMKANYRLRTALELTTAGYTDRPSTALAPYGTFEQDWVFDASAGGDLDACNGRWGVTPESPSTSVYHYFMTDSYPFVQRCVFGTLPTSTWANDNAQN